MTVNHEKNVFFFFVSLVYIVRSLHCW